MKKILITGTSGLLGSNLVMSLKDRYDVIGTDINNSIKFPDIEYKTMDICVSDSVKEIIFSVKPHVIIHCAAETRVDYCEDNPDAAFLVNVRGTEIIAGACREIGSKIVYISTDSVFDGFKGFYNESDKTAPLNVYAKSKLSGEQVVAKQAGYFLILRTNIYGWNAQAKTSLAEWILDSVSNGKRIPGFEDIIFAPLLVNDLALLIDKMIGRGLGGLYHVNAANKCSKLEFAKMICKLFSKDEALVYAGKSDEINFKARRPKDTSLDISKIKQDLGENMPGVLDGLTHFRQLWENGYVKQLRSGRIPQEVKQ